MADLTFYFDPVCPWSWRTSVWIREVQRLHGLEVEWKVFSLADINKRSDPTARAPIRTAVLARREGGNDAIDGVYQALGHAMHGERANLKDPQVAAAVLADAGLDRTLMARAMDDPSTIDDVTAEHNEAVERFGAFGVPWLVLAGQDFGFYGPVIDEVPHDTAASELWSHMSWALTQPYLYEIKRERG